MPTPSDSLISRFWTVTLVAVMRTSLSWVMGRHCLPADGTVPGQRPSPASLAGVSRGSWYCPWMMGSSPSALGIPVRIVPGLLTVICSW